MIFFFPIPSNPCVHSFIVTKDGIDVLYRRSQDSDRLSAFAFPYIEYTCVMCRKITRDAKGTSFRAENKDISREDLVRYKYAIKFKMI